LRTLISNTLTISCGILILLAQLVGAAEFKERDCLNKAVYPGQVVRIDTTNTRVFVAIKSVTRGYVQNSVPKVAACVQAMGWKEDWDISYFSHKKYCGYVDEPRMEKFGAAWYKGYLAEYYNTARYYAAGDPNVGELVMKPAFKPIKDYYVIHKHIHEPSPKD